MVVWARKSRFCKRYETFSTIFNIDHAGKFCWIHFQFYPMYHTFSTWMADRCCCSHTSSMERFSENLDDKVVTYLIFFVWTHWFQKCNFWKHSLGPFWGRRGRWGQTTSKLKTVKILNKNSSKIDEIQILASATSKMASATSRISGGAHWIFPKNTFFKSGQSTEKNKL